MRTTFLAGLLALAPCASACMKTEYHHGSVSGAVATPDTVGFGLGATHVSTRSIFGRSEFDDTRVEHAAGTTTDGTRDRFWRTYVDATQPPDLLLGFLQRLELCEGTPAAPGPCADATMAEMTTPIAGLPTILESANLAVSARLTETTANGTTLVSAQGGVVMPTSRRATAAFGIWIAMNPTSQGALFSLGATTGALLFCHAPEGSPPRCLPLPTDAQPVSRVLSVQTLRRGAQDVHVVWYQAHAAATYTTRARPSNVIVRCEADDVQPTPQCQSTEVEP